MKSLNNRLTRNPEAIRISPAPAQHDENADLYQQQNELRRLRQELKQRLRRVRAENGVMAGKLALKRLEAQLRRACKRAVELYLLDEKVASL